jgi:predicted permease
MGGLIAQDLKSAFRALARSRGFALIAIGTLALGIAGTTLIFSLVDGILLRPLAYRDPGRLVSITEIVPEFSQRYPRLPVNARHFELWRRQSTSFAGMSLVIPESTVLTRAGEPLKIATARVSPGFFQMLGVHLGLGREFLDSEDRFGGPAVAILTDRLWTGRFHRDPAILSKPVYLDGNATTVVGVLGADFRPPVLHDMTLTSVARDTDIFQPAALDLANIGMVGEFNYETVARLKPGVALTQAQSELNVVQAAIDRQAPDIAHVRAQLSPLASEVIGSVRTGLVTLLGAIGAVFLIICVNLANLSLARGVSQSRENAIRRALGASRAEMLGRALAESILTSLIGGAIGVVLAYAGLHVLLRFAPVDLPRLNEVAIDARVLAFAFALATLAGAMFGSLPAWQASKADPQDALRSGSHTITTGRAGARIRDALIGVEVGLGAVLAIAAALLVASFIHLLNVHKGFETQHLFAATLNLPGASYDATGARESFYRRVIGQIENAPGVASAAIISQLPLEGETWIDLVNRTGGRRLTFELPEANFRFISPDYFRTMGIPMLRGRSIEDRDRQRNVAVISEKVAQKVWPGEDPIGKKFWRGDPDAPPFEIVGVAGDVRAGIAHDAPMTVYTPYWFRSRTTMALVVRTSSNMSAILPAVRSAIRRLNPDVAISNIRTMDQVVDDSVAQRRFQMNLISGFAVFALLLASLGIFGVVSWTVKRRMKDIAVRMALGATRADVHAMVVLQCMRPVFAGLTLGVAAALALGRVLSHLLFGVSAHDPAIFAGVVGLLTAVSLMACYGPARGATRANPVDVLRYE